MSVVACTHPATTGPSRAHHLRRHVFHQEELGPTVRTNQDPQEAPRDIVFHPHSPLAGELDVLERLSKVNERRGSRETHQSGEFACHTALPSRVLEVCAVYPNQST